MIKRKQCKMNRIERRTNYKTSEAKVNEMSTLSTMAPREPFVFFATRMRKSCKLTRTYEISHFNYFFSSVYYRNVMLSPKEASRVMEHLKRDRI